MSRTDRSAINSYSAAGMADAGAIRSQLNEMRLNAESSKRTAVMDALRKYRYHIFTRYNWSTGSGFAGKISFLMFMMTGALRISDCLTLIVD